MNPPSQDGQPQASTADTRPPSHDVKNFTCNMALPEKLHMKHEFHIWDSTKNSPNYETWGRNFGANSDSEIARVTISSCTATTRERQILECCESGE